MPLPFDAEFPNVCHMIQQSLFSSVSNELATLLTELHYLRGWKEGAQSSFFFQQAADEPPPLAPMPVSLDLKPPDQWVFESCPESDVTVPSSR